MVEKFSLRDESSKFNVMVHYRKEHALLRMGYLNPRQPVEYSGVVYKATVDTYVDGLVYVLKGWTLKIPSMFYNTKILSSKVLISQDDSDFQVAVLKYQYPKVLQIYSETNYLNMQIVSGRLSQDDITEICEALGKVRNL